jgi:hypothetical protein
MAIYRGPGGAGDATSDSASEASIAVQKANEAATSATAAATSASSAATSASAAASSATGAASSALAASASATSASGSATSATASAATATTKASEASTSASNAATSAAAALASETVVAASAAAAASSASAASTSATNASTSATSAGSSASSATSSASAAASSASAAATSAGLASTSQSQAASSASAASTSATSASSFASSAETSATTAGTAASTATSQAFIATTKASEASSSATSAASSATSAAASYDSFDDRYLGSKTSDPSLDNDGNALLTGALYWNSVSSALKAYTGSAWNVAYVPSTNYVLKAGDTMTGNLTLPASTSSLVPLHVSVGTKPSTLIDGDIWVEPTGLFVKNNTYAHQLDFDTNTAGVVVKPVITVASGGATFSASATEAFLYSLSNYNGDFKKFIIPAATGLALTDGVASYLAVSYNAGNPIYIVTTNVTLLNGSDVAGAALLFRNGSEVHHQSIDWGLAPASRLNRRTVQTDRYERGTGLALSESTGRVITLTSGIIWYGVTEYVEPAVTSASSNCEFWYHSSGVWTKTDVSTYNNNQYDNGTTLVTLSGAGTQYAVNWVFRYLDGDSLPKLAYILGSGNYTLAQAQGSSVPVPPPGLTSMALLVGRIIVAQGAATATQINSAFTSVFSGSTVTDHNDLANLQGGAAEEYYHLTSAEYVWLQSIEGALVSGTINGGTY